MKRPRRPRAQAGLSMIEVVLSFIVVSIMLLGALEAVAASRRTVAIAERSATARFLADELLAQVFAKSYSDPNETAILGIELTEVAGGKASMDDLDDFDGWRESPPRDATGGKLAGYDGWSREVSVEWVAPDSPNSVKSSETGARRITVIAKFNGAEYGRAVAIRTDSPTPKQP